MSNELDYGNMTIRVEMVTPAVAKRWLEQNEANRRIRPKVAKMYQNDMQNGKWEKKPIAICFDAAGKLGNGQHTLTAIIASGVAQEMLVARGCTREQIASMDIGLRRSISDISHFVGVDLSRREAAIARILVYGPEDDAARSFSEMLDAYIQHEDAITFVVDRAKAKQAGLNASVLSVVAAAWYSVDREDLARFIQILVDGISTEPRDKSAILLRDFCRSLRGGWGSVLRAEAHRKAQSALDSYISGRAMTKLYGYAQPKFVVPVSPGASQRSAYPERSTSRAAP